MKTINNILICTDFSKEATNALIYGVNLAEKLGVQSTILHVKTEHSGTEEEIEAQFRDIRHDYLFLAKMKYTFLCRPGEIAEVVKEVIRENNIDMTIVGMRGVTAHKTVLSGSITASMIERPCSALLNVPAKARILDISHIGLATDGTDPDEKAMGFLVDLGHKINAKISVFHIHKSSLHEPETVVETMENKFGSLLGDTYTGFSDVDGENVVNSLTTYAQDQSIDLLTVMHHCGGEVRNPMKRSISKQLAFRTKVPLLILPVV
jgi:nucleotide-binding universal stress UspA family protein